MTFVSARQRRNSYIYLALCILVWASIPVASKKVLVELDNLQLLFYSTIFSFLVSGALLLAQGKQRQLYRYSTREYGIMAVLGFLGCYLYYLLLYGALALTTASEGFILAYTWPIMILILAVIILREPLTVRKIAGILIGFFGIVVIVTQGSIVTVHLTSLRGDLLALAGALSFALFSVLGKRYNFDQTISVFVFFATALLLVCITVPATSGIPWPSAKIWPWLLYNGLLVNGISYIWWFKALEYGKTHIISNALYLTPFISLIYIWLLLDESIMASALLGLLIIISGIALQSIGAAKQEPARIHEGHHV